MGCCNSALVAKLCKLLQNVWLHKEYNVSKIKYEITLNVWVFTKLIFTIMECGNSIWVAKLYRMFHNVWRKVMLTYKNMQCAKKGHRMIYSNTDEYSYNRYWNFDIHETFCIQLKNFNNLLNNSISILPIGETSTVISCLKKSNDETFVKYSNNAYKCKCTYQLVLDSSKLSTE